MGESPYRRYLPPAHANESNRDETNRLLSQGNASKGNEELGTEPKRPVSQTNASRQFTELFCRVSLAQANRRARKGIALMRNALIRNETRRKELSCRAFKTNASSSFNERA